MLPGFENFQTGHVVSTHNKTKNRKIFFATNARNTVKFKNNVRTLYINLHPNNVFLRFKCSRKSKILINFNIIGIKMFGSVSRIFRMHK